MSLVLPRQLQENLLTLLVWSETACKFIRSSVEMELWDEGYQDIVRRVYRYIDRYKKAPGDHISDLLDAVLEGKDEKKARRYRETLFYLKESQEAINEPFILTRLGDFVRRQAIKSAIVECAPLLSGPEDRLDEIESRLLKAVKNRTMVWDPGTRLSDKDRALAFLRRSTENEFITGIPALDRLGLTPARKALWVGVAPPKRGKSWMMVNMAKAALQLRQRVVYVTLELSEEHVSRRMIQSWFAVPKKRGEYMQIRLIGQKDGNRLTKLRHQLLKRRISFEGDDAFERFSKKIKKWRRLMSRLYIKEFPTGQLTISGLEAYLDMLYDREGFMPDLLIVDYPDLMKTRSENYRLELGQIYKDIRGICVERNMAGVAVSQTTRSAVEARTINEKHIAEDFSKVATADTMVFYTQTKQEKELQLARLYVAASRTEADKMTIMISQNYVTGQFCLDSRVLASNYWKLIDAEADEEEPEDGSTREAQQ